MIRALRLRNAGPFRGEHRLELEPKAYAITARYDADPGRSNWGGKSFLMEMVDLAITGRLKKARRYDADGWITKGERDGGVFLDLEGGFTIARERRRGSATQIRFTWPDGRTASQGDAEVAIMKHLGFDADDFRNVAYFESKQMARLIHTEPEKRSEIVSGWLGTAKAEAAEARATTLVGIAVRKVKELRSSRATLTEQLEQLTGIAEEAELLAARDAATARLLAAQEARQRLRSETDERAKAGALIEEYDEIVAQGTNVAARVAQIELSGSDLDAVAAFAQKELEAKSAIHVNAQTETAAKKKVSLGLFNGACPVAPIECPAKKQINSDRAGSQAVYQKAVKDEEDARVDLELVRRNARVALAEAEEGKAQRALLAKLRAQAAEKQPAYKAAKKLLKVPEASGYAEALAELEAAQAARDEAVSALAEASAKRKQRERLASALAEVNAAIELVAAEAGVATKTREIFRATQRRVSERALGAIGSRASAMLLGAGIDLSVDIRWEYEGKNLAKACDDCGAAFPASAKVKACESCGAARGMHVVRRLEFLRSDQSDAADDLAGVSLQLAAGSWLLGARSSPWACAMLDEPLAACDKTNRRAIAMQLVRLLGSGTWRQALVISHSSDTIDAFPGRIEVVVARDGSRSLVQT